MTCAACERRVRRELSRVPGVEGVTVSAARGSAVLTCGEAPAPEAVRAAVLRAGYTPGAPAWLSRDGATWRTLAVAVLVAAGIVLVAVRLGLRLPSPSTTGGGPLLALAVGLAAGFSTCMALVGGLVLSVSASRAGGGGPEAPGGWVRLRPHLVFTAGRWAGFALGGALLGLIGSAARLPGPAIALGTVAAAAVMALLGVRLTGMSPRLAGWSPHLPAGWGERSGLNGDRGALLAGAATFLLPCGFTQAMQVYAVSLGSPAAAAATMTAFAVGTTPGLLGLGALGGLTRWRDRGLTAMRVIGVVVLAFAVITGVGGLRALGLDLPSWPVAPSTAAASTPTTVSANVRLQDGVQVVDLTQRADGYSPADTTVWAGVPIRWQINVTSGFSCSTALRVPSLGVSADLPQVGHHVIELPALPVGVTKFTCVMGMYTGTLRAIPRPAPQ